MLTADLSFSYADGRDIFHSLSFSLEKGGKILIISEPGSGKSSLSRILTGALPGYTGGTITGHAEIDGKDILALPSYERMEMIGRVSQNTDELLLFSSVEEEISFPLINMGLNKEEREKRISSSLKLFGLTQYRGVSTSELSGGEKRRLILSILFAIDPDVYVLDEAFDELSPYWRGRLRDVIRSSERSMIVLGSHMLGEYVDTFDNILSIENGALRAYTPHDSSFAIPAMKKGVSVLRAADLSIERMHRSAGSTFTLSVPDFELCEGECVTLLGDNGSGKSSLARVLSGLLKEKSGSVSIDGKALTVRERRHDVAYLMQNPYEELFIPTVSDELESTGASSEKIDSVLSFFSLERDEYVQELSYGKAKMVQAAIFLLLGRRFAILDEMDSALSAEDFYKVISSFLENGTGVLVITHDMNVAATLPGRKLMIEGGVLNEH